MQLNPSSFVSHFRGVNAVLLLTSPAFVRLNGVNAKEHPVYRELTRVKQYFDKIKDVEFPAQQTQTLDKPAAARVIKHALVTTLLLLLDDVADTSK